jgi:hypothetical protein
MWLSYTDALPVIEPARQLLRKTCGKIKSFEEAGDLI